MALLNAEVDKFKKQWIEQEDDLARASSELKVAQNERTNLESEVRRAFATLVQGDAAATVAVRSSATAEDLAETIGREVRLREHHVAVLEEDRLRDLASLEDERSRFFGDRQVVQQLGETDLLQPPRARRGIRGWDGFRHA